MKTARVLAVALAGAAGLLLAAGALAAGPDPTPVGLWRTVDDQTGREKSLVRLTMEGDRLVGTIEKLLYFPPDDPNPKCVKCSGERKDQPITGMRILWDLRLDGDEWTGGSILDPESGKTYRCTVALDDGGQKLKVRGFLGFSLLGRTQVWKRES